MRIYIDLDSRRILTSSMRPASQLEFKRRDNDFFEVQFLRAGTVQSLPVGSISRVGVKATDDFAGAFLATDTLSVSGTGFETVYTGNFNLNTVALEALFTAEPASVSAMMEVQWMSGSAVGSSLTLPITIFNDVIRGNEGDPAALPLFYTSTTSDFIASQAEAEAGVDNTKWMSPLRTSQAIAALAATDWASIADKPATFAPSAHTHQLAGITQSGATSGQVATWNGAAWVPQTPSSGGASSWNSLTGKPSVFPPDEHTHTAGQITSGTLDIDLLPTGTSSTTVALGNHTHANFMTTSGGVTAIEVVASMPATPLESTLYIVTG
jgi:hypothetical protein